MDQNNLFARQKRLTLAANKFVKTIIKIDNASLKFLHTSTDMDSKNKTA